MGARTTSILSALVCVLALGVLVATSAFAGEPECKHPGLCIEKTRIGSTEKPVNTNVVVHGVAGAPSVFNLGTGSMTITCETMSEWGEVPVINSGFSANLERLGLRFTNCKTKVGAKEETCSVEGFATVPLKSGFFGTKAETLKFEGATESFMSLSVTNGPKGPCLSALQGNYTEKGYIECTLKEAETETAVKEISCKESGSHLKATAGMFGVQVTSITAQLELAGTNKGKKFSV